MRLSILTIIALLFFNCVGAQYYTGTVTYTNPDASEYDTVTYFFMPDKIKKIVTFKENSLLGKLYDEIIWDLPLQKMYIINHKNKTIYEDILEIIPIASISDTIEKKLINNFLCGAVINNKKNIINMPSRDDTITLKTAMYVNSNLMVFPFKEKSKKILGEWEFPAGYIPLYIEKTRIAFNQKKTFHSSVIAISNIIPKADFFKIPDNYVVLKYNNDNMINKIQEIRENMDDIMQQIEDGVKLKTQED